MNVSKSKKRRQSMNQVNRGNIFASVMMGVQLIVMFLVGMLLYGLNTHLDTTTMQTIYELLVVVPPVLIYLAVSGESPKEVFSLNKISIGNILFIVILVVFAMPIGMFISLISAQFFPNTVSEVVGQITSESQGLFIPLTALALVPAVLEELAFRGIVFSAYKKVDIKKAALVNGLFFAMFHLNLQQFLYTFALGIFFSYLVHYTRSILSSVIAHFTFNGIVVVLSRLISSAESSVSGLAAVGTANVAQSAEETASAIGSFAWLAMISGVIFFALFSAFVKYNNRINSENEEFYIPEMQPDQNETNTPDIQETSIQAERRAAVALIEKRESKILRPTFFITIITYIFMSIILYAIAHSW